MPMDILGAAPVAIITAGMGWIGSAWAYRDRRKDKQFEHAERMEIHQDGLTFELLQAARGEVSVAYTEMKTLREEVKSLRALEQHFFHFQQAIDHLEAILFADNAQARVQAERAGRAFIKRMRRLNDAKGTLRNEVQLQDSVVHLADGKITNVETDIKPDEKP